MDEPTRTGRDPRRSDTTDAVASPTAGAAPAGFVVAALGVTLLLFGLFRIPWIQNTLLIPYAHGQEAFAGRVTGLRPLPVFVDFSCTGADVVALLVGAIAAFPASASRRLKGIFVGLLLVTVVNTVRIGSLALVVGRREIFDRLHTVVWPAILIALVTLYVFAWMRGTSNAALAGTPAARRRPGAAIRFALWLAAAVAIFFAASNWYLESRWLFAVSAWAAACGGVIIRALGVDATVSGAALTTPHGSFLVTPICMATPLIPVYFAAVVALPMTGRRRLSYLVAAPFVFFALGTLRLLVLALPDALLHSHLEAIHAFNQVVFALLLAAAAVFSRRRATGEPRGGELRRLGVALLAGAGAAAIASALGGWLFPRLAAVVGTPFGPEIASLPDPQGALSISPAYELALWVALTVALGGWSRRRSGRLAASVAVIFGGQLAVLSGLAFVWSHWGTVAPVPAVRGWAVIVPVALALWTSGWRGRPPARHEPLPFEAEPAA